MSRSKVLKGRGELVASVLAGSWRRSAPPLQLSADALAPIASHLIRLGAGALAWRRLQAGRASDSPAAVELRQAYRMQALDARLHERRIVRAIGVLRAAGVEPLLAKGWAAARLYPELGLRPYGDIDLWVPPHQHPVAVATLASPDAQVCRVDLHAGFTQLDGTWAEICERSRLARLGEVEIRLLGAEDHLRLLCLHMLGHGAFRPIWLCDIAAAIETLPDDFDWARCLLGDPRQAHWVTCAVGLAQQVLGARAADGLPEQPIPRWLRTALLRQWGRAEHYMSTPSMSFVLRRPRLLARALRLRWPNPIEATVDLHAPFNRLPRLPLQIAECLVRTVRFTRQELLQAPPA